MPRPIQAVISAPAIAHNLAVVRQHCGSARIWAVVKANAYGHGLKNILDGLAQADGLALLDLAEAELLRGLGWQGPILMLEGFFDATDLERFTELDLTPVIHCEEQINLLEQSAPTHRMPVYLKLNSGMNRLGFRGYAYPAAYARLRQLSAARVIGDISLMSHFANADVVAGVMANPMTSVAQQMEIFARASHGMHPVERSLANSAAIFDHPSSHLDWVRPGIMLYGATPFADRSAQSLGLRAAMTLQSAIIAMQEIDAGESVGYGSQYVAMRAMRIGVVACGYADGYPRIAPNGTPVMVGGLPTQTIGRVSMDMLTVDLSHLPGIGVGTPVELWGEQLPVDEVAQAAGTVGYELLCALAGRVPVVALDSKWETSTFY